MPTPFSEIDLLTRLYEALTTDSEGNPAFRTVATGYAADSVNETHIDWGTGTNQVSAADMPIADAGNLFTTDNVEAALAELANIVLKSGASRDATYIVQVPNATLTNEQALSTLATGILKNTTETGILSIAAQGVDYWAPGGTDVAVADGGTGASTAADARTNLGLVIGTNVQAYDAELAALAGLVSAADQLPYFTGSGSASLTTLTTFGRSLIDDDTSSTARSTLGLGTLATQAANNVNITGGAISGITDLAVADGGTGASTLTGILKGNGTAAFSAAAQGTDYWAPGGTDVAVADGGTGGSTASAARSNLGAAASGSNADITALTAIAAAAGIVMGPYGASAGNTSEIRFAELAGNGSNYVGFKAPDAISANKVWVLPAADGSNGDVLKTDGAGNLSFESAGGGGSMFGTGADGAITWSTSTNLNPDVVKNYTTSTLDSGQTLSVSSTNKVLRIFSSGNVNIQGTVDLNAKGAAADTNGASVSTAILTGCGGQSTAGGGGNNASGGGGGGGSMFAVGTAGATPSPGTTGGSAGTIISSSDAAILNALFSLAVCGAGGGTAGQSQSGQAGGAGGAGGGALIWFIGGNLTLGASAIIRANGANGSNGGGGGVYGAGGGGGGGGGSILIIVAGSITNSGATLSATAGSGGNGGSGSTKAGGTGGGGGAGKVIVYSLSTGTFITA